MRWEARIHRGTPTILFIPRNEIHCVWKMSDMTRHAGVSGAQISEDQGRQKTKDIIHPGDVLTVDNKTDLNHKQETTNIY